MKKLVPDPPIDSPNTYRYPELKLANQALRQSLAEQPVEAVPFASLATTSSVRVTPDSLFHVREGISAEEALVHVSLLLKCAEEVSDEITERGSGLERGLIWSMVHSVEMARAVVDALLDGRGAH
ncbi:DUF3077 domain-containing protein [Pseudomonas chlororaphis subsp. piscium]|nr:DUF3077 domain-containing protein [Pseudomonas chlororaphis subsp. piscium]